MHYSCDEQVRVAAKTQVAATEHSRQLAVYIGMVIIGASRVLLRSQLIHHGWVRGKPEETQLSLLQLTHH